MTDQVRRQRWDLSMSPEERRAEIVRALGEFLRERHLSTLKMQDIADRLGMTKGNLYYYFKDKQAILFHCHMKSMERSLAALDAVERMPGTHAERLRELLVQHVRSITDEAYSAVLLSDLDNLSEEQRAAYVELRDRFEVGVRRLIEAGVAGGEFVEADVRLLGFAMLGGINWIAKWYDTRGSRSAQEIAETFADLFVRGVRRPPAG